MPHIPKFIASVKVGDDTLSLFCVGNYHYQIVNCWDWEVFEDMPETDFTTACELLNSCGTDIKTAY